MIVTLSSKEATLPVAALSEVDSALSAIGLRKQVRSTLISGKEFSTTYDGPTIDKTKVEEAVATLADKYAFTFSVELEESVSFP